jgi:hypothetical protein
MGFFFHVKETIQRINKTIQKINRKREETERDLGLEPCKG